MIFSPSHFQALAACPTRGTAYLWRKLRRSTAIWQGRFSLIQPETGDLPPIGAGPRCCDNRCREGFRGIHQPMNIRLQSRQVARDPSMVMSRCRHFLQRAQRRPELSETSCLQVAISSRLSAAGKTPGCMAAETTASTCGSV